MDDNENNQSDLQETDINETEETNYTGAFLAIGAGLGVSYGILFDNLAIGMSFGAALGLLIGAVAESAKKKK